MTVGGEVVRLVKAVATAKAGPAATPGSVEEQRAQITVLPRENRELTRASAILSEAAVFRGGARPPKEVAAFVAAHRHHGPSRSAGCSTREHPIAPSAVRSATARPVCARRLEAVIVRPKLVGLLDANYREYGRRKMKAALRREHGINLGKDRIACLMRELGIPRRATHQDNGHHPLRQALAAATGSGQAPFPRGATQPVVGLRFHICADWSGFFYAALVTEWSRLAAGSADSVGVSTC